MMPPKSCICQWCVCWQNAQILSSQHCFHSTLVDASHMLLVCVDTAVGRTACSSTSVQIQIGNISHLLVSTTTLTVYTNLSSFTVDWYADPPCYTWVSTPCHTCMFHNLHPLTLKIHVICVVHFQDDQEFNPTASCLCQFISGTFHLNFILQNSWHHCCKVWKEVTWN